MSNRLHSILGYWVIGCLALTARIAAAEVSFYSMEDYPNVNKIDAHVHIRTMDPEFVTLAAQDRMRFVNIVVHSPSDEELKARHQTAFAQLKAHPRRIAVAAAFPMKGWDEPDWVGNTLAHLDDAFNQGAIAVKVWKNIGMEFRDKNGELVMIDDPRLDPVFDHLQERNIRLIGHLGEPKNCWLPLEEMTVNNDRNYFRNHPEYHMFKHPDMPSYEDQIAARNRMLDKHEDLTFMGAHLGSLEWSVDKIAEFLDAYPNATVDTAARVAHLQYQSQRDRGRVRDFLIRYQDRIIYGTDIGVGEGVNAEIAHASAQRRWLSDWKYFCTDEIQPVSELNDPVAGLKLPKEVIDKIYNRNAERVFDRGWSDSSQNKP